jgi:hypothetical protein
VANRRASAGRCYHRARAREKRAPFWVSTARGLRPGSPRADVGFSYSLRVKCETGRNPLVVQFLPPRASSYARSITGSIDEEAGLAQNSCETAVELSDTPMAQLPADGCEVSGDIVFDEAQAPVYVVTFSGAVTDSQFDQYLEQLSALAERGGQRALVYDARRASPARPSQRRKQAEWMKKFEDPIRRGTAGIAFVIPSALIRGCLTAILWLQPLACPHVVTGNFEHALRWARERPGLNSAGRELANGSQMRRPR